MTQRAQQATMICGTIAALVTLATMIALWPHARYFTLVLPLFVGGFYSNEVFVGYIPLPLPGFRDQVKGLMLGGKSEAAAVAEVSRGMEFQAYYFLFMTVLCCAAFACVVLNLFSRINLQIVGPIIGWAALGLATLMFLVIVVLLVLLPIAYFRTKKPL
jgi:hypothetical protein